VKIKVKRINISFIICIAINPPLAPPLEGKKCFFIAEGILDSGGYEFV